MEVSGRDAFKEDLSLCKGFVVAYERNAVRKSHSVRWVAGLTKILDILFESLREMGGFVCKSVCPHQKPDSVLLRFDRGDAERNFFGR